MHVGGHGRPSRVTRRAFGWFWEGLLRGVLAPLGASWQRLGGSSEALGGLSASSWSFLGPSERRLGVILGRSWAILAPS
eukprot:9371298-Pyramimonas_sp.AAC.1